jgi:hypothetical protein
MDEEELLQAESLRFHQNVVLTLKTNVGYNQGRIYARAKGARAQGGILKKNSRLKYGMRGKKAVHKREI